MMTTVPTPTLQILPRRTPTLPTLAVSPPIVSPPILATPVVATPIVPTLIVPTLTARPAGLATLAAGVARAARVPRTCVPLCAALAFALFATQATIAQSQSPVAQPTAAQSTVAQLAGAQPAVAQPAVAQPAAAGPAAAQPGTTKPDAAQPGAAQSSGAQSSGAQSSGATAGEAGVRHTPNTLKLAAGQAGPPATLRDAAWLAGAWAGQGLGGVSEEHWTAPAGGAMLGMYRIIHEGKATFYELLTLTEEKGSLVMKLKHFNPDMTGWEEKADMTRFPLVKITKDQLFFNGLTFTRVDEDRMTIHLALRGKDGTVREEIFTHTRMAR